MAAKYAEPEHQQKYMAGLEANLESGTGRSLAQWIKIAKTCPHARLNDRLKWFKEKHGLGMARAGLVLWKTFGEKLLGSDDPDELVDGLFAKTFATQRPIYETIAAFVRGLDGAMVSPRKTYVAFYRAKQFAVVKPSREGLMLGYALPPDGRRLKPARKLGGGDRILSYIPLATPKDFDADAKALLKKAWAQN